MSLRTAWLLLGVGVSAWACNAISGASDLVARDVVDAGVDSGVTIDGGAFADGAPPACAEGEARCDGDTAVACVAGAWQSTPCSEVCEGGACLPFPSCRNDAGAGCGAGTSCCATAKVPSATVKLPASISTASVSAFALDVHEVTVGRFRAFVAAGGATQDKPPAAGAGAHPKIPNSGWRAEWNEELPFDLADLLDQLDGLEPTWTEAPAGQEHLPIQNVTWYEAFAFCAWDGARLPTYAEWTAAAAGGEQQRVYPWSSSTDPYAISSAQAAYDCGFDPPSESCTSEHCSSGASAPCDDSCVAPDTCVPTSCTGCSFSDIAPVGVHGPGAGRWGHLDLAGNVAELVLDRDGIRPNPCNDCALLVDDGGLYGPKPRVMLLGGSWRDSASSLQTVASRTSRTDDAKQTVGFRCARDLHE